MGVSRLVSRGLRRVADRLDRPTAVDRRALARRIVGGLWDEMGRAQLDFLVSRGLEPTDVLLDVGCGALRGGVPLIRYLEPGNYCGVDAQQWLLDVAHVELAESGLADRRPQLRCDDTFDFTAFGRTFDVALAQSVFTHLNLNAIQRCLVEVADVLRREGVFYATILENRGDPNNLSPIVFEQPDLPPTIAFADKNPFHYHVRIFEDLVRSLPLKLEYVGEWGSLRGQSMLAFHRT